MSKQLYPLVSADVALFSIGEGCLQVLLVQRAEEPAAGRWALPGAVLKPLIDRDLEATARRALRDKISVEVPYLEQLRTFAGKDRDPRGWSLSALHYALLPRDQIQAMVRRKVDVVRWADADSESRTLAFDHGEQLYAARSALRQRVKEHALPLHLMPERFTLTQLQRVCEVILASGEGEASLSTREHSGGASPAARTSSRFQGSATSVRIGLHSCSGLHRGSGSSSLESQLAVNPLQLWRRRSVFVDRPR